MSVKTIDDIFASYKAYLLGVQPTANVDTTDSDHWIRGRTNSGVMSGLSADIDRVGQDAFPQNARREALLRWKQALFNVSTFDPATVAIGNVALTGDPAAAFTAGLQMTHVASGNVYAVTTSGVLDGTGNGSAEIQSILAGQAQNLQPGAQLSISAAPVGIDGAAFVDADGISDGTNEEDEARLSLRVLNRLQEAARGGNDNDYVEWALESSPAVTSAAVLRYPMGAGTVAVIITSGTTDIDAAVDAGDVVDFTPSPELIAIAEAYIEARNTTTACAFVYGVDLVTLDVTVTVAFTSGNKDTVLSGQTLTQGELVEREVQRAIYKMGTGGTLFPNGNRYATKKAIEDGIDSHLSAIDTVQGTDLQIVLNRVVSNLDGVNSDKQVTANQRPYPGTISIVDA